MKQYVSYILCCIIWWRFSFKGLYFSYYVQQPGRLSSLITRGKDDLCSLVKYPSKSRERHLQKISLDERYVRPKCLWCYFSFFAVAVEAHQKKM